MISVTLLAFKKNAVASNLAWSRETSDTFQRFLPASTKFSVTLMKRPVVMCWIRNAWPQFMKPPFHLKQENFSFWVKHSMAFLVVFMTVVIYRFLISSIRHKDRARFSASPPSYTITLKIKTTEKLQQFDQTWDYLLQIVLRVIRPVFGDRHTFIMTVEKANHFLTKNKANELVLDIARCNRQDGPQCLMKGRDNRWFIRF